MSVGGLGVFVTLVDEDESFCGEGARVDSLRDNLLGGFCFLGDGGLLTSF